METQQYDILILGTGAGGKLLAWTLAKQGKRVAAIERKYIGGSCPNIACLPSKNVIHSAKVASYFQQSEEFGITKDNFRIHMPKIRDRKRKMVNDLVDIHLDHFKKSGAELVMGSGSFIAPKTLKVELAKGETRILKGHKIFLDVGTQATISPIPGLAESNPMTHIQALELDVVPDHLLILGGGYVGLEFAQAMRRFGSKVTLIVRSEKLGHKEDADVSDALQELCFDEGMQILFKTETTKVEGVSGQSIKLHLNQNGSRRQLEGSHLLVATGRTANTKNIGLDLAGIETTDSGYIKVNERLETSAPDVWALGECAGSPKFTHISVNDFCIIRDNLAGKNRTTNDRQVPFCLYTDPELARVGLNETEAKAFGISYRVLKIPMAAVLRTHTLSEKRGFMKALIDPKNHQILGFTAFGVGAGEIMATVQVAMIGKMPYTVLRDAIFTHPTLPEGLNELFSLES